MQQPQPRERVRQMTAGAYESDVQWLEDERKRLGYSLSAYVAHIIREFRNDVREQDAKKRK